MSVLVAEARDIAERLLMEAPYVDPDIGTRVIDGADILRLVQLLNAALADLGGE